MHPQTRLLQTGVFLLFSSLAMAQPAGLVLNEVSQGSSGTREFAELVVVGPPCSTVDIRGWILDDNNGEFIDCAGPNSGAIPGVAISPGHVRFKYDPIWQNVPVGTIILVYAWDPADPLAQAEIGGLAVDYTDSNCDLLRVVPLNASNTYMEMENSLPTGASSGCCPNGTNGNPAYTPATYVPLTNQAFSGVTGKLALLNGGDGFQIRNASAAFFHGLSYGTTTSSCVPTPLFDGGPYGIQIGPSGPNITYQFRNTVSDDYTVVGNFANFPANSTQSAGMPNNCDNAQWIGSLRRPPESIFVTSGAACATNPSASSQSLCVGQTITLTLPNTNACTSNSFSWSFSGSGSVTVQGSSTNSTITLLATGSGSVNAQITATISNSTLYTQGGCSGPQFPQSLTYTFPLVITPGPSAFPAVVTACNMGNGQAVFNLTSVNSTVNGNSGLPVSWYQNAAATIPIPNPSSYTSGPGTVYAVVTSGPCSSNPVAVTLVVLPLPIAFPTSLAGCNQGNGQGAYNLTTLNNIVNGNTGLTVNYWIDAAATVPINNPANYIGGPGTIYATVTNPPCSSAPVPITLTVVPVPTTANTFITVNPTVACGASATVTVTFFFPSANLYNVTLLYGALTFNGQNLGNGAIANFTISQTTPFILTSVTLAQNSLCTVNFSNPPVLIVTLIDPPNLAITGGTVICEGESIDLDTVVTDTNNPPGTIPITFHSAQPPTAVNLINSLVAPTTTTTYYAYANGGTGCQQTLPVTITVTSGGTPVLGSTSVCSDDPPLDLILLMDPGFPSGTWSGPGVTGNFFDPSGLSGEQTLTFTPEGCGNPATTTVDVLPAGTPVLGTVTLCQADPPYDLVQLQDPAFPNGAWGGPGVSGNFFDPSGQSDTVTLVFTPVEFCTSPGLTDIIVIPLGMPVLGADTLCSTAAPIDLATLEDPNYPEGIWSGPGVQDTLFDPSVFSSDTLVTLTFTSSAYCTAENTTTIWVAASFVPSLLTDTLCNTEPVLDLTMLEDPGFPGGVWSGQGVSGSNFDPTGLGGAITLSYVYPGPCIDTAYTTLIVVPSGTPVLGSADICEINGVFDLTVLQDTLYPGGTWSGPGVTGTTFDPTGQSGDVILTYTPAESCANAANATVTVTASAQPVLSNATVCENSGLLDLVLMQDPNFPDGTWSGPGVTGTNFDPLGQSGAVVLTFTPSDTCFLPATADVLINLPPGIANLVETCDPNTLTYTVSFDITGGDPGTYTVNGTPATTPFTSGAFNSGVPYSFSVDDANGCGPATATGTVDCACATSGGTMDTAAGPLEVCEGFSFDANDYFNGDAVLDGNDLLQFVLHDSPGNALGNIIAIESSGVFAYPGNIVPFQSYYLSAIAGNDNGTGNVDLNDPCLSVSAGIEVIFLELSVTYSGDSSFCENLCYDWTLSFTGLPPFTLEFNIIAGPINQPATLVVFQSDTTLTFCPADYGISSGTVGLEPTNLFDALCSETASGLPPTVLTVFPQAFSLIDPVLCPGGTMVVNGTTYDEANPAGTEVILGGTVNGCDSTISVQLSFFPPAQSAIVQTLCDGESLTVNGTVYDVTNPLGTELIAGGSANGCDSTITVDLSFYPPSGSNLVQALCEGESITVNGTVYDQNNPSGTEVILNGSFTGCDSTVTVALTFSPNSDFDITNTLCDGESMTVNGTTYDQSNPSGVEIIPNGNYLGCDSTINVSLSFVPNSVNNINPTLCQGGSLVVNGTTYDQSNPSGTELIPNGSYQGCDSTINVLLSFYPPATGTLSSTLCAEDFLTINGTVYNAGNPSGTEFFPNGSANGCDSTLTVALNFLPPVEFLLTDTLATGQSINVNGTIYNEANPTGTEVFVNGSYQGCDSTVTIQLFFEVFEFIYSTLAPSCYGFQDGQIVVEGISGAKPPYLISIDGVFFEPIGSLPFVWGDLSAGTYLVTLQDANGETFTFNVVIPSKTQPVLNLGPDLELELGESANVTATANFIISQITWQPGTFLDCDTCVAVTLVEPQNDITYSVTALDPDGCPVTGILAVTVRKLFKLYVPSIFSPNADGNNDLFMVFAGAEVQQIREFQVYNRWGGLMYSASNFQPNDPANGWDGYFKGRLMDAGVYVYFMEVEFVDGSTSIVKGGITLIR